MQETMETAT